MAKPVAKKIQRRYEFTPVEFAKTLGVDPERITSVSQDASVIPPIYVLVTEE